VTSTPIVHGHASSRFDKDPQTLAKQVARATGTPEANLLSWTEVGDEKLTWDPPE
jgi:hypothetical protein